ncbi:amidase [Phlyctema vagabunda]|uniref:Amidase n=1 Tax=Phlyctema vagabunda TaxID=108571 RepID=A0ABR4PMG8_9HELO
MIFYPNDSTAIYPDLLEIDVEEIIVGLESEFWTSVDLINAYTQRIREVSWLNAVTEINPDASSIAQTLDAERSAGHLRGILHGVPILIKNNIATMDKMNNTAGSYSLLGATVPRDSTVVAKLRAAGLIILGKANMSQWAQFRSSKINTTSGWSAYGGQVTGAYYPNMSPSGSSSGSSVATSIGLAMAALGTETDGSIVVPCSVSNLVGIKPTVGLTSRSLIIPLSEHQDSVGPIARSVKDAAYILSIIAGKDHFDNYTSAQPFNVPPDYTQALDLAALKNARIGVPRNAMDREENAIRRPVLNAFEKAIQIIQGAGATVVENTNFSAWDEYVIDSRAPLGNKSIVLGADFVSDLGQYLSQLTSNPQNITSLADVSAFTQNSPSEQHSTHDTSSWDQALALKFDNNDAHFWQSYQHRLYFGGEGGVVGALEKYNLDALIMPTDYSPDLPAAAGLPVITVPLGFYPSDYPIYKDPNGLVIIGPNIPFGISFLGRKWSEEKLIGLAYAYEQITHTRQKRNPVILPKTQITDVLKSYI